MYAVSKKLAGETVKHGVRCVGSASGKYVLEITIANDKTYTAKIEEIWNRVKSYFTAEVVAQWIGGTAGYVTFVVLVPAPVSLVGTGLCAAGGTVASSLGELLLPGVFKRVSTYCVPKDPTSTVVEMEELNSDGTLSRSTKGVDPVVASMLSTADWVVMPDKISKEKEPVAKISQNSGILFAEYKGGADQQITFTNLFKRPNGTKPKFSDDMQIAARTVATRHKRCFSNG